MKSFLQRGFALSIAFIGSFIFASSCSSHFSSNKADEAGAVQLTSQQKKQQLANLSVNLQGEWVCSGSDDGSKQCMGETLTFSAALDQLIIENTWHFCRVHTDYQLTMGVEDADGMTDFSIHTNGLGQLVGASAASQDCKNYLATFSNNPLDEDFSFSHSADWSQITIGDNNFTKAPSPQPSASPLPSPSSSTQPSNP
jgi:hypothetical protein